MNAWIPIVQLALLIAGPSTPSGSKPNGDAPPNAEARAVAVEIDTSKLGDFGDFFDRRLDYEIRTRAKQRELTIAPKARGRIRVVVSQTGTVAFQYSVETTPWTVGAAPTSTSGTCDPCSDEMAVVKITEALEARFDALADAPKEATPADVAAEPGDVDVASPPSRQPEDDQKKVGALGWGGIGVALGGAATGAAGIALLLRKDQLRVDETRPVQSERTSTRRSGIALAAVGGVLVVAGIVMVVVDHVKMKRRRTAWAPAVAPGLVGLELAGRF